jgi:predicted metal-binding membrane protein
MGASVDDPGSSSNVCVSYRGTVTVGQEEHTRRPIDGVAVHLVLLALAAAGWYWSARMASDMTMPSMDGMAGMSGMEGMSGMGTTTISLAAFMLAWVAMMAAMMFPAISPVVKLYGRAAAAGRVAPLPFFVAGYIVVWTVIGLPAYFAWRALMEPVAAAEPWAARVAGGVLLAAAAWQLTPLKSVCLKHCRTPMSVFLRFSGSTARPLGAARMGATHGLYCLGCCWALMAVLVAMGTMTIAWMIALAALIMLEKNAPWGERVAMGAAVVFAVLGVMLFIRPESLSSLT